MPQYNLNSAEVGIMHQSVNQSINQSINQSNLDPHAFVYDEYIHVYKWTL